MNDTSTTLPRSDAMSNRLPAVSISTVSGAGPMSASGLRDGAAKATTSARIPALPKGGSLINRRGYGGRETLNLASFRRCLRGRIRNEDRERVLFIIVIPHLRADLGNRRIAQRSLRPASPLLPVLLLDPPDLLFAQSVNQQLVSSKLHL